MKLSRLGSLASWPLWKNVAPTSLLLQYSELFKDGVVDADHGAEPAPRRLQEPRRLMGRPDSLQLSFTVRDDG